MRKTEFNPPRVDFTSDALLFDLDGTLVDIAATPDAVIVPRDLRPTLLRLLERTGGALALITGRTIESLDRTMAPLKLPAMGCHGAQFRLDPNAPVAARAAELPDSVRGLFHDVTMKQPGVEMEDKGYTIVFHYRAVPERAQNLLDLVRDRMKSVPPEIELMHGKASIEIKPRAFTKGKAVRTLMTLKPFLDRRPIYAGDDTTDEDVFAELPHMGGVGISVSHRLKGADLCVPSPQALRDWLAQVAHT
jgi:trehalose 6-phosphate phosphatase